MIVGSIKKVIQNIEFTLTVREESWFSRLVKTPTLTILTLLVLSVPSYAGLSIEILYLYDLQGTTKDSHFRRQNGLFCDGERNETYVVDTGNRCIRIFGKEGMEIFKFGHNGELLAPLDAAVNGRGDIYVLESASGGKRRIQVFDFRGERLSTLELKGLPGDEEYKPVDIAIDPDDNIYLSDPSRGCILSFDPEGRYRFKIVPEMTAKEREEVVFGHLMIDEGGRLYLPVSTLGTVYVFDSDGRFLRNFGRKGGGPGKLAFPVDVALDRHGHFLVLDKLRHCISVYDHKGSYLTEFGGRGVRPGWFFYPSALEIDRYGRIYVSQTFGNKIQVLKVKEEFE